MAGRSIGRPASHGDHPVVELQFQLADEPPAHLAEGQAVAHGHRPGADEALPTGPQAQTLDRPAGRVRPVEHPDGLAVARGGFQDVAQRRNEGVDAAAKVLQIDQQDIEAGHHRLGWPAHLAVQAIYRNAMHRVEEVR
jgi:hypothetical protein